VFWDGAQDHQVLLQRCRSCGYMWHPPGPRCPRCRLVEWEWRPATGKGSVYTYTVLRYAAHSAFAESVPYNVALVELVEGPRILSTIRRCPLSGLRVALAVDLAFEEAVDGFVFPVFVPQSKQE
jgi:uncharacterized OB-fold protein